MVHTYFSITVVVYSVGFIVAGHKLTESDGTCKGAFDRFGIDTVVVTELDELFQLTPEKAVAPVRFKSEGCQGIEDRIFSCVFSINTLYTDDRGDVFVGYAKSLFGKCKSRFVFADKCSAVSDTFWCNFKSDIAIPCTVQRVSFDLFGSGFTLFTGKKTQRCLLCANIFKERFEVGKFKIFLCNHLVDKILYGRCFCVVFCKKCCS